MNYNNSYTPENYIMNNYNLSKSENLMNYVKNINNLNKKYTREQEINDLENGNTIKNNNNIEENEIIPERSLTNYINNKFLSDAILKIHENEFYIHKIILCSCSDYINNQFLSNPQPKEKEKNEENNENKTNKESRENEIDNKDKIVINFPEIIPSSFGGGNRLNCIEKILKYCYNNQVFKSIENDINQYNIFTLLELSHCLGIKTLKLNLENKIIKNYLDKDNVAKLAIESKIFDLQKLNKECINFIIKNFKDVKIFKNDILDLDFDTFKQIMSSEQINIDNEKDISDFVINYIKTRREIPDEIIENKENKENIIKEEEKKEEKKEEEKKEEDKEKEKEKEKNENINEKWKNDLLKLKESVKKRKLSKEEEKEIIMCIKFDNLSHTELVRLTNEPIMNEYKDLLLKSLSSKLKSYEGMGNNDNQEMNMNPRFYSPHKNLNDSKNRFYYSDNTFNNNRNNFEFMNHKSMSNPEFSNYPENPKIYTNNTPNEESEFFNSQIRNNLKYYNNNSRNVYNNSRNNYNNNFCRSNNNIIKNNDTDEDNYKNINFNNEENENYYNINRNNKYNDNEYDDYYNDKEENILNSQFFNINNKREKEKINRYRQMLKSEDIKMTNNKIEQSSLSSSNKQLIYPLNYNIKFKYKYDFDRNGIFYYLGTYALSRKYQNPHDIKLIKAFGSSLLSGYFSDFVGRNIVNLCSENEENSFFGVDLGPNRYLLPTLYSIRNRDSSSNVLLNWQLEGSNDKINFTTLDKRMFGIENTNEKNKEQYRKYRNLLKEPKTTSTWGISKSVREIYPNGFRYFILKQIGKNSSGNYNMAISGFEMYGEGIGNGWIFS